MACLVAAVEAGLSKVVSNVALLADEMRRSGIRHGHAVVHSPGARPRVQLDKLPHPQPAVVFRARDRFEQSTRRRSVDPNRRIGGNRDPGTQSHAPARDPFDSSFQTDFDFAPGEAKVLNSPCGICRAEQRSQ
jgi:hypothetical protein